jgi:glycosyltransferase involved in cell wall biosynthesis
MFKAAGHDADVAFFGIPDFWTADNTGEFWIWFEVKYGITSKNYWLYPHRPSTDKGIGNVLTVAEALPDETFVISTASPLPDHKEIMKLCKQTVKHLDLKNVKFVDIPDSPYYQFHRRALITNAKAVLCPFPYPSQYHDTGGLVGAESMRTGTPLIVTRSPGSEEWWGAQSDKGVVFIDGADSLKMAIRHWSTYDLHPECPYSTENYAKDYINIITKYTA